MKITKSEFVKSVIGDDYSLKDNFPQFAFFGRSNAGKSSVINSLTNREDLVKTSKVSGRTRKANFFRINNSFYFIDFPGYGYAKLSIIERDKMIKRIFWYIEFSNVKPRVVFLIIDARVGLTKIDEEMIDILKKSNHQIIIIANKIDKIKKSLLKEKISSIQEKAQNILVFEYSAKTNEGREELLSKIESFL
jgi:GTP-binding protein